MQAAKRKDAGEAYGKLCTALAGEERDFFLTILRTPELVKLPKLILAYYIEMEEYEKCKVLKQVMDEIDHPD